MTAADMSADVVVVGGGLVGSVLALALASGGAEVIVVDRLSPTAQTDAGFDGRASAIALAPKRMLERIGLWNRLASDATPILDIRVSDGDSRLFLHYDSRDVGTPALGYMVENRHIRAALFDALASESLVRLLAPAEVLGLETAGAGARVTLADGRVLAAPLVVGADGRGSRIRTLAGIDVTGWSYPQTGIVCTVAHERPHHNVAHEHFLPAGPFAILPISGNRSSLVWTERADRAPAVLALPEAEFLAELQRRFGDFLGTLERVGPTWSYPLELHLADSATAPRLALVGDAAHGLHPIAGQGFNLGLRDVAALAESVVDTLRLGLDAGHAHVLDAYGGWRRFDTVLMLSLTDALNRLFSNDVAPLRIARDLGLAAVNQAGPLKRLFMRHAMGVAGELPRLLKGEAL